MKIFAPKTPVVGQEITVYTDVMHKPGDAAPVFVDGQRVALARIMEDVSKNPHYTSQKHGGGLTNMAKGFFRVIVESIYE